jgi:uncharacterized membrane protein
MPAPTDLFEMRRLEMLSNTIFGVAMTLLAYDLPKASGLGAAPDWSELARVYAPHILPLMLSFIIAGMFWVTHQRRLAYAPHGSFGTVCLNLLFLLSIIILPVTNGLYGSYAMSSVVAVAYGLHLSLIAALNAVLWAIALRGQHQANLIAACTPVVVFLLGTAVAVYAPGRAQLVWFLAFAAPLIGWAARRRTQY